MSESTDSSESIPLEAIATAVRENRHAESAKLTEDYRTVIQENYGRYKKSFERMLTKKSKAGINIAAFFLPVLWSFCRKMYGTGTIILLIYGAVQAVVMCTADTETMVPLWVSLGVMIFARLVYAIFADYLYKRKVEKVIACAESMHPAARREYLNSRGGVTYLSCAILLYFCALAEYLLYMFVIR